MAQLEFRGGNVEAERPTKVFELDVVLEKNKESCFDGYSIKALDKKDITPIVKGDGKEHVFYGMNMGIEDNGEFIFECYGSNDKIIYGTHVKVDLSSNPVLADFVRENPGKELEVTYIWESSITEPIEYVVPINIKESE